MEGLTEAEKFVELMKSRVGAIACADAIIPIIPLLHHVPPPPSDDPDAENPDAASPTDRLAALLHSVGVARGYPLLDLSSKKAAKRSTLCGNLPTPAAYKAPLPSLARWNVMLLSQNLSSAPTTESSKRSRDD